MKHAVYNHNRDIYISYPIDQVPFAKCGNIICKDDFVIHVVKAKEVETKTFDLAIANCPLDFNVDFITSDDLQVLVLYVSDNTDHIKYLQDAIMETEQFRNSLKINFTGMSSDENSRVVTADYNLPMQHKFTHLNTLSLRYAK